ncbi:hypothetical protein BASA61_002104 [Batrachochytrium salamandrivorans]|nr:hypothetical protein BASA61_002104 [Batrachochytrium salamandrivorans]
MCCYHWVCFGYLPDIHKPRIVLGDIEAFISISAKLKSKPTEEVTVHFQHPLLSISTCVIVFNPNNWDTPQQLIAIPAPLFVGSSDPPRRLSFNSQLLAKAVTASPLSEELSSVDIFEITRADAPRHVCSAGGDNVDTFDRISFPLNKPGWYNMVSTSDNTVQVLMGRCAREPLCVKSVLLRYGSSVMSMNVNGPVKDISEYSVTEVTPNVNGLRYTRGTKPGEHKVVFPYGTELRLQLINRGNNVFLLVFLTIDSGHPLPGGFCNILRPPSPKNKLLGSRGESSDPSNREEVTAYAESWSVKDANVLTNPDVVDKIQRCPKPARI